MFYQKKMATLFFSVTILSLMISACGGEAQPTNVENQVSYPTVFVTQIITPVVATLPAITPTPRPAASGGQPQSGVWDPFAVPVYYPLTGCSASRLYVGDRAFVVYSGGLVGIYKRKNLEFDPNLYHPSVGQELLIVDGPYCNEGWIFWQVMTPDEEIQGYMPEGNGEAYWLLPLPPLAEE